MPRVLLIPFIFCFFHTEAQVSKAQLQGVWSVTSMGMLDSDTVIILDRDSGIANTFPSYRFVHIAEKIYTAKTAPESMAYNVLGMFSNMFFQFDSLGNYGEGMKPRTPEEKPDVKRGTFTLKEGKLITGKDVSFVFFQHPYLVITTATGSMMYLKKTGNVLY